MSQVWSLTCFPGSDLYIYIYLGEATFPAHFDSAINIFMGINFIICIHSVLGWVCFSSMIKQHFHFHPFPILVHLLVQLTETNFWQEEVIHPRNLSRETRPYMRFYPFECEVRKWPATLNAYVLNDMPSQSAFIGMKTGRVADLGTTIKELVPPRRRQSTGTLKTVSL